ncbi:MAG: hypothetical protein ACYDGY_00750 [Acidimicrobiales bacterium]
MPDADREQQLEAEIEVLRAENAQQASEIEYLTRKVFELEQRLNQGSKNSAPSVERLAETTGRSNQDAGRPSGTRPRRSARATSNAAGASSPVHRGRTWR